MGNFKDKLARFMSGRYGQDQLYYVMLVICFVLMIVNLIIKSAIIGALLWAVLFWMIFRSFSRNIYKRQMENERFMKIWNPVKAKGLFTIRRFKEIKTHRYRKCRHCKAMLRLPVKKGKHTVKCPRCNSEFDVRVLL